MRSSGKSRLPMIVAAFAAVLWLAFPHSMWAQGTGGVSGTVTRSDNRAPLAGVIVLVKGTAIRTVTNTNGRYTLERVPVGPTTLEFRWVGYSPRELPVTIAAGTPATLDAALDPLPVTLSEIMVSGASRAPERVTEAPSAISSIDPRAMVTTSPLGQAPLALRNVPGVDLTQSGLTDFNVNARGFNSTLNRRVLVLQDGRDLAIAFLGSQEWNTLTQPTEDFSKMEFVSGPGSALYGANAYSGVLDITTPNAREVLGTKVTLAGGFLGTDGDWNGGSPSSYRGDLRHATTFGEGRYGLRLNVGASASDTWTRSRTAADSLSIRREYEPVYCSGLSDTECTDTLAARVPKTAPERLALRGQGIGAGGEPTGDRDPIKSYYGSARFDMYAANGNVATFEGGYAKVQNEVFVTGIGRVQVYDAARPWGRFEYAAASYNVMAYWNGRRTNEPQFSLASTAPLRETSDIFHLEAQANTSFSNERGRLVYGASVRNTRLDTDTTLMIGLDDDRSDYSYAGFAQLTWELAEKVRLVVAGRFDLGSLIDPQFSPKAALVVNPTPNQSIRFTVNQAFQTPNYSEFYLRAAAGAPANFTALEAGLRASPLGPALAGVPVGQLFACSSFTTPCAATTSAVPVAARGNSTLDVEKNTGYEVGWRGDVSRRIFASVDVYYNRLSNFVTDLLPGVNPEFPFWTSPTAVPQPARAPLETAVRDALLANPATRIAGLGLTRQENGNTAIVVSYGNAGNAEQYGVDVATGLQATDQLRFDLTGSWFDYDVTDAATGDRLLANTPEWRANLAASYGGRNLDLGLNYRYSSGFPWAAGVFVGEIEPGHTFDANAGYRISPTFRVFLAGTNLVNRQWFSIYGGSVNGRRVMGGVTATF